MKQLFTILFLICTYFLFAVTINVPDDQSTIQAGINAASNTDTVLVQPGTYVENIYFNGKLITVGSLFLTTQDTSYISSTIIDGNNVSNVVSFEGGEDPSSILTGFTITNGNTNLGGGIYCEEASPSLEYLIITNNSASTSGGGIYCADNSSPILQNVIIKNNTAEEGGGIYSSWNADASLENVVITSNSADVYGGGIYCINTSPVLYNVTISWNSAVYSGGGIYCVDDSNPALENVTIANNTAGTSGGGIYCNNSNPTVTNSILWDDSPDEIYIYYSGSVTTTYSDIEGGWAGTGNIDNDPFFVDPPNRDYHLTWANYPVQDATKSACIDAGDPASTLDPDGTITDMGAYYFHQHFGHIWHISTTGSDITGDGSELYPFATIQHGINTSSNTETVLVQPGTYFENINYNGKNITVASLFLTTQDTTYISQTIIDGSSSGSVVTFTNSENSSAVLCGFTITNGSALQGGGIYCNNSSPSLENVTISGNSSSYRGGGIYCYDNSNPSLQYVTISGNLASDEGGGIYCTGSSPSLNNVTITSNSAGWYGGGIYSNNSMPSIINSILWNDYPGEIYIAGTFPITVTYSDIQWGWIGLGNINSDPLFVDPGNGDYHLQSISPCINTGDPSSPLDPDGTRADMGAYSFNHTIGAPAITAVTDVPSDQGRFVIVTWQRSIWDNELSTIPIFSYNLWEKYPFEPDRESTITNDIKRAILEQDTYFQREDTTWVLIENFAAMQWEEYSALAETFFDSTTVGDYLSYFFVSAHTSNPSLYFSSSVASGYSVDSIAPDEADVYIAQNGSNIGLTWDEVEYGTFQGNSYPEINGIWYKIYAGDSPDFVCDEAHLIDIVTDLNYDYPLTGEDKKFFKIVVSDQPEAGRFVNRFKKPEKPAGDYKKVGKMLLLK